jgi:MoaA/NifB/PqqE/SkfB family radical SAM enzyme
MVKAKGFKTFNELHNSQWLKKIQMDMIFDEWPDECMRCKQTEDTIGESIRTKSITRHKMLHPLKKDYLVVGGVLDNVCNSACQTCNAELSTKIGSLEKNYIKTNNFAKFFKLPQSRILEVDVNGGEPTASKNYKKLLANLPRKTKIVRMNTNGSRMIDEIITLLKKKIMVIVTISLDGVGDVHDYVRWPIKWKDYTKTVEKYKKLQEQYKLLKLDFWTTVSCLNVGDLPNIIEYAKNKNIPHAWAFLNTPDALNVKYKNNLTTNAKHIAPDKIAIAENNSDQLKLFIKKQDYVRKINIRDYLPIIDYWLQLTLII